VEETLKVIEELVNSFRVMQDEYQQELERMEKELEAQKNQWLSMSEAIEEKMARFKGEYDKLAREVVRSENLVKNL
jgi:SMC interacting uncharacterized protein involved in chromosome segregation